MKKAGNELVLTDLEIISFIVAHVDGSLGSVMFLQVSTAADDFISRHSHLTTSNKANSCRLDR